MTLTLTETVLQLILAGVQVVPSIIQAAQTEIALWKSGTAATPDQQAAIDAALDQANAALQAS